MATFGRELKLYQMMLGYCEKLVADLDDETLQGAVGPGLNHPLWIVGHLAICTDFALQLLGHPTRCSTTWHQQFAPGSDPGQWAALPKKEELLQALADGHARVAVAVRSVSAKRLQEPHDFEPLLAALPTKADLLAHLLTTHEAAHLGQLSAWRRQRGLPHVL